SRYGDYRNASLRNRGLHRDLQHPRHLFRMRNQFAVMATFREELFRMGFLKISAAYFTTWDLGSDGEHWHTTSVTIVKPINQMHVARPAAPRADGEASGQVCFGAGGKRCRLFMSHMNPLKLFLFSNRVCKPVEGVARKSINPFHSRLNERIYH